MACACKKKKAAGQVTAIKQVAKKAIVSSHVPGFESTTNTTPSTSTATTVKRNVVKRIMFKRR